MNAVIRYVLAALLATAVPEPAAFAAPGGDSIEATIAKADALAAKARAEQDPARKAKALDAALAAYADAIALRPKDAKLVPRLRRRRASLLKRAGRPGAALAEHDTIVAGRARRRDKARALFDGALLLERGGDFAAAEKRLRRAIEDYRDIVRIRADAGLARGRVFEAMGRPREAARAYRFVIEHSRDQVKPAIGAYDALALLALRRGDPKEARRWLRTCAREYEKRATRRDKFGAYVGRLLGDMKAPRALAEAARAAAEREAGPETDADPDAGREAGRATDRKPREDGTR